MNLEREEIGKSTLSNPLDEQGKQRKPFFGIRRA